tara:strand:+ start:176 stop:1045 length:870 start_codon:yes stop_codon:yes gene_type:complete
MANAKELSRKITSLRNMQKVTRAMNMIATIKLRKLFSLQEPLERFSRAVDEMAAEINTALAAQSHPVVSDYSARRRGNIVIFTADKGLCGAHNNSVTRELALTIQEWTHRNQAAEVTSFGLKGTSFCRRREFTIFNQAEINDRSLNTEQLKQTARMLLTRFLSGEIQEVAVIYNRFVNTLQQETTVKTLLPISAPPGDETRRPGTTSVEPEVDAFAESAAELYLYYSLRIALYNSYLSEHASRMTAMENATHNSEDLIANYVTLQNRARQSAITNEIIEIVSGIEAMNG